MSGRLDSNQRPPEPHSGLRIAKGPYSPKKSRIGISMNSTFYMFRQPYARFLLPLLPKQVQAVPVAPLHGGEEAWHAVAAARGPADQITRCSDGPRKQPTSQ